MLTGTPHLEGSRDNEAHLASLSTTTTYDEEAIWALYSELRRAEEGVVHHKELLFEVTFITQKNRQRSGEGFQVFVCFFLFFLIRPESAQRN